MLHLQVFKLFKLNLGCYKVRDKKCLICKFSNFSNFLVSVAPTTHIVTMLFAILLLVLLLLILPAIIGFTTFSLSNNNSLDDELSEDEDDQDIFFDFTGENSDQNSDYSLPELEDDVSDGQNSDQNTDDNMPELDDSNASKSFFQRSIISTQ